MTREHYILKDGNPVPADLETWARWYETADRQIEQTEDVFYGWEVSTVFLGLDQNFTGHGPPMLFETMVFGGKFDQECERYCTLEEAKNGHAEMVERVKATGGESK